MPAMSKRALKLVTSSKAIEHSKTWRQSIYGSDRRIAALRRLKNGERRDHCGRQTSNSLCGTASKCLGVAISLCRIAGRQSCGSAQRLHGSYHRWSAD